MKSRHIASLFVILALVGWTLPASAQWVVVDPTNFSVNFLTSVRSLTQIENQIEQLANEARMLENEARNLKGLNYSSLSQLQATIATTQHLLSQAQGMDYQLVRVQQDFARFYPPTYTAGTPRSQVNADSMARWSYSQAATGTAMQLQAQASMNFDSDIAVLSNLVNNSQSAAGALQAAQATNQLLALQARQTVQSQQLAIAEDRAAALEHARTVEAEARARVFRQQFMTGTTLYTPAPSSFF